MSQAAWPLGWTLQGIHIGMQGLHSCNFVCKPAGADLAAGVHLVNLQILVALV
jgi:hypothetical protein